MAMTVFACHIASSKENGHWHKTYEEAEECRESWAKWNNPVSKVSRWIPSFSYKPHGVFEKDRKFS